MLFTPPVAPTNPHHPFVYDWLKSRIEHVGDLGDRYEADVWRTRDGWRWDARFWAFKATDADEPVAYEDLAWDVAPGGTEASEDEAAGAAVAWLRGRCVAVHGSVG